MGVITLKITKTKLQQLIREELAKLTEARRPHGGRGPGAYEPPGEKEPDYSEPVDAGPEPIRDPVRAAEIVYDDIVFDGIKNWIANNGPDLDLDEVIASLGRYIVENPAE